AARGLQTQWVVDVQADPDFLGGPPDVVGEIAVPLHYKGRLLGVLSVQSSAGRPFTRHDMPLLEAVAGAMNVSLENQRLTGESQQRLASLESLWAMSADLNAKLGLPDLLEAVLRRAAAVSAAAHGGIFLVDPRREDLVLTAGYHWPADGELRLPAGEGIAGRAVSARMPLVVGNSSSGSGRLSRASRSDGGTTLAVPIVWGDVAMGAIVLTHPDARRGFDRATVQIVSAFAAQAGSAIHTARLYEAEQRKARQLEAIQQINRQVAMSLDRHALLSQVIALVGSHLSYPTVCLYLIQGDHAVPAAGDVDRSPVRLGEGVIGWVARMGQSVLVPDGEPTPTLLDAGTLPTSRAQLAVPISMGSHVLGVIDVQSQTANEFDEVDELGLGAVAAQTAVALVNADHFQDATRRGGAVGAVCDGAGCVGGAESERCASDDEQGARVDGWGDGGRG
ncbi:MAG: GAF domain-containing protein, partial [Anaerolineae bacterium]|nr:GAF domain-containing protein [Anaerolineae bacterium]